MEWLTGMFSDPATAPAAWGLLGLVLLLLALLAVTRLRHARRGMFIAGGRKHRLAVLDATAIDSRRRLVLVRRDEVEHLILIGGHNDLVVETSIGQDAETAEPAADRSEPARKEEPATASALASASTAPDERTARQNESKPASATADRTADTAAAPAPPVVAALDDRPPRVEPPMTATPRPHSDTAWQSVPELSPETARRQDPAPVRHDAVQPVTSTPPSRPGDNAPMPPAPAVAPAARSAPPAPSAERSDTSLDEEMERLLHGLLDEQSDRQR